MNLEFIFKVIDKEEWQKAKQSGTYGGSEKDIFISQRKIRLRKH